MKTCSKCNTEKDESEFYKCTLARKSAWCKECFDRNNKRNHSEKYHIRGLLSGCRYRAKLKGIEFNLQEEDIQIPKTCPVLGIPINQFGNIRCSHNSPSIDRIDNKKGYVKGNILVVSNRANSLKKDATVEELKMIFEFYSKIT